MAPEASPAPSGVGGIQVNRVFEQSPDAISLYCDFFQAVLTGQEVVLQFYETIPGPPGPDGKIQLVRTRLRATITLGMANAANIGRGSTEQVQKASAVAQAQAGGKQP